MIELKLGNYFIYIIARQCSAIVNGLWLCQRGKQVLREGTFVGAVVEFRRREAQGVDEAGGHLYSSVHGLRVHSVRPTPVHRSCQELRRTSWLEDWRPGATGGRARRAPIGARSFRASALSRSAAQGVARGCTSRRHGRWRGIVQGHKHSTFRAGWGDIQ